MNGNYNIINLNYFFMRAPSNCHDDSLDQVMPKRQPGEKEIINKLRLCSPCYCGTITMDPKIYNHLDTEGMERIIRKTFDSYAKELKQRKNVYYYAQLEYTKSHIPHIHLLTNGYRSIFLRHFSPLGKANKHKNSYQKLKHFDEYIKYMNKECARKIDGITTIQEKIPLYG